MRALARIIEHAGAALLRRRALALGKEHDSLLVDLTGYLMLGSQRLLKLHLLLGALLLVGKDGVLARAIILL